MKTNYLIHKFVEYIPEKKEEGILYISIKYCIAVHKCACGCGQEVVTPISPTDWQLYFDGETVSLSPSIGNWNFDCHSHYWIKKNCIIEATSLSKYKKNTEKNKRRKKSFFKNHFHFL